jgi:hypothetical protein
VEGKDEGGSVALNPPCGGMQDESKAFLIHPSAFILLF